MSIDAISSSVPVLPQAEVQKASTTPLLAQSTPAPADTFSICAPVTNLQELAMPTTMVAKYKRLNCPRKTCTARPERLCPHPCGHC
jgi:hypothetical protein